MSNPINPPGHAPDLEPQLEAAVWAVLTEPLDTDAIARVKARAAALGLSVATASTLPESSAVAGPVNSNHVASDHESVIRSTRAPATYLPRSLLVKLLSTVAGIFLIVAMTFLFQSTPSAFGNVLQQLRTAQSFTYTTRIYQEGNSKPIETKVMVAEDGRRRSEMGEDTVTIMDSSSIIRLTLLKRTKRAIAYEYGKRLPMGPKSSELAWLENLKSHGDKPDEKLGRKMLNGRDVEGFIARQMQFVYTVWVDTKTKELVEVEHASFVEGSQISKVVLTDFRFNETLDDSLFRFDIPEGYKVLEQPEVPMVAGGEKSIVEALRGYTERSAGKFPKSITEWGEWVVLVSANSQDGKLDARATEIMSHLGSIIPFLVSRSKDDYQYLGAGKSLKDERCVIFWYRNDEKKLRAIYNDLTVSEIQEKELPSQKQ